MNMFCYCVLRLFAEINFILFKSLVVEQGARWPASLGQASPGGMPTTRVL